jgi:hypothetical protein
MSELYIRIRPGKDSPGAYHALGILFNAGRWHRLPERFIWDGQEIDTKARFSKIVNAVEAPVFQVCTKDEADAISEADRQAEVLRMIAEQQQASRVAPVEAAVTPAVTPAPPKAETKVDSGDEGDEESGEAKTTRAGSRGRRGQPAE